MKKTTMALATLVAISGFAASAAQAQAQSTGSVQIYGLLDTGVEYLSNVGSTHTSLTRMPGLTGSLPSRLGFRGTEDLGGGLRAVFTLEQGVGVDSGTLNQGGRAFGRQAWVGLSGDWGTVTAGRNYTMLYWGLWDGDQLGPNAFGLSSLDNYLPNDRIDNSVAYRGTFGGFTVGASYSLGRDTVNAGPSPSGANCAGESATDSKACKEWSVLLKYDSPTWGLAFATDELHGGTGAYANLSTGSMTDRRITLNGYGKFDGGFKVVAGIIRRDNDGAAAASATNGATHRSNLIWVGGAWSPDVRYTIDAQLQRLSFDGGDSSTLAVLRGTYNFSKRTAAYAQLGRMSNGKRLAYSVSSAAAGGAPVAGSDQSGAMVGLRHSF